jgi:hypothetical protein
MEKLQSDVTQLLAMVGRLDGGLDAAQLRRKIVAVLVPGCAADVSLLDAAVYGADPVKDKRIRENAITYAMKALMADPNSHVVKVNFKMPPATGPGRTGDSAKWRLRVGIVLSTQASVNAMVTTTNLPQPNLCTQLQTTNLP